MNLVFQLTQRPDLAEAQRLSDALERERGVTSALVDPQQAQVFVTFDPDLTGDMVLQDVVTRMGYQVAHEGEPLGFTTETPGYTSEVQDERMRLASAVGLEQDATFSLPGLESRSSEGATEVHYGATESSER